MIGLQGSGVFVSQTKPNVPKLESLCSKSPKIKYPSITYTVHNVNPAIPFHPKLSIGRCARRHAHGLRRISEILARENPFCLSFSLVGSMIFPELVGSHW